jgi:hypothetical protein
LRGTGPDVVDDGCPEVSSEGLLLMRFLQSVNGHHAVQRVTGGEIRRKEDREGRYILVTDGRKTGSDVDFK